jgi:hypothetical protein
MKSPIRVLDQDIINSLLKIAPEHQEKLEEFKVKFDPEVFFTSDRKFSFRVDTENKVIKIPTVSLEYLWCASYTFYLIYQKYTIAHNSSTDKVFDLQSDPELKLALEMYQWSNNSLRNKDGFCWKENYPSPQKNTEDMESDESIATELFLCAIAWILHHEIAHIYHQHPNQTTDAESRAQEKEADSSATKWILENITDSKILQKRGLGIAIAVLAITSQDILSGSFNATTHPKSFERLFDVIDPYFIDENHLVYSFITIILRFHMTIRGLEIDINSGDSWKDDFTNCLLTLKCI